MFSKPTARIGAIGKDEIEMDVTLSDIISVVGLIIGGSGIGYFFHWRLSKRQELAKTKQEEANAMQAETTAVKEVQDVYQQLITDIKTDRDEQKAYINELKEDRRHLRDDRDELRKRQDELEEQVRSLQRDVARNGRQVESMRPLLCGLIGCKNRKPVTITEDKQPKQ